MVKAHFHVRHGSADPEPSRTREYWINRHRRYHPVRRHICMAAMQTLERLMTQSPIQEQPMGHLIMTERIQTGKAKEILGISLRSVQNLAAKGELPSAAKCGRSWTFNEADLRRYVAEREEANRQQAAARAKPCPRPKQAITKAPSYGSFSAYASALGISVADLATKTAQRSRRGAPIAS
jgi:Helix-turn-helix domain